MVGFDPSSSVSVPVYIPGVAGGLSGFITRGITQPLDVLKIRLQDTPSGSVTQPKYHGMRHACRLIGREEKLAAFWKGHVPGQVLSMVFGLVEFSSFQLLTTFVWRIFPRSLSAEFQPFSHFICGSFAGCCATLASQPFDVLRTRFIAQGKPNVYRSMLDAFKQIVSREGPASLYLGLTPSLVQIAPQIGFQFAFYSSFTHLWNTRARQNSSSSTDLTTTHSVDAIESLVCGGAAGAGAKIIVHPLDVIKKRLQIAGFEYGHVVVGRPRWYIGIADCVQWIVKNEGLRGLYKGLSASLLKAVISSGLYFFFYEQSYHVLTDYYTTSSS